MRIKAIAILFAVSLLMACGEQKEPEEAQALLDTAAGQLERKQYDSALASIDSLRKNYPRAVHARKQALKLYQDIELQRAEEELAAVDQALLEARAEYESMRQEAETHHAAGTATAAELTRVTQMRMHRDSLQIQFDMQCAKIKYIRQKQKE